MAKINARPDDALVNGSPRNGFARWSRAKRSVPNGYIVDLSEGAQTILFLNLKFDCGAEKTQ